MSEPIQWTPESIVQYGGRNGGREIRFGEIIPFFEQGLSNEEILKTPTMGDLKAQKLDKIRAYYLRSYACDQTGPSLPLRVFCDENLSRRHTLTCVRLFGAAAASAALDGLLRENDRTVWDRNVANGTDIIMTYDQKYRTLQKTEEQRCWRERDLTFIALGAWAEAYGVSRDMIERGDPLPYRPDIKLPMIMHVTEDTFDADIFEAAVHKQLKNIFALHARKEGPVIRLTKEDVHQVAVHKPKNKKPRKERRAERRRQREAQAIALAA